MTTDNQLNLALERTHRWLRAQRFRSFAALCEELAKAALEIGWKEQALKAEEWRECALQRADAIEGFSTE